MSTHDLNPREKQILTMISYGVTQKSIVRELGISPTTLGSILKSVRNKLQAKSTAHAVALAIRGGIL